MIPWYMSLKGICIISLSILLSAASIVCFAQKARIAGIEAEAVGLKEERGKALLGVKALQANLAAVKAQTDRSKALAVDLARAREIIRKINTTTTMGGCTDAANEVVIQGTTLDIINFANGGLPPAPGNLSTPNHQVLPISGSTGADPWKSIDGKRSPR